MVTNHSPKASSGPPTSRVFLLSSFGLFLGVVGMGVGLFSLQRQQAQQFRLFELARQSQSRHETTVASTPHADVCWVDVVSSETNGTTFRIELSRWAPILSTRDTRDD